MSEHHGGNGELIAVGAAGLAVCVLPALVVLAGALGVGDVLGPLALGAGATALGTLLVMRGRHRRRSHPPREAPQNGAAGKAV